MSLGSGPLGGPTCRGSWPAGGGREREVEDAVPPEESV